MAVYNQLPSRFNYEKYYLDQAAGGPSFPIFRARQSGGLSFGFLAPLLRRHGVPLLKWLGGQAATLASNLGNTYLQEGRLSKENVKNQLKAQGKAAAGSVLDKIKQQIGSGMYHRDARLGALIPKYTGNANGFLTNQHHIRGPNVSETIFTPHSRQKRKTTKKHKVTTKHRKGKSKKGKAIKVKKAKSKSIQVKKTKSRTRKKVVKRQPPSHTIFS